MSMWISYAIADKITAILTEVPDYLPTHHFTRPFLTAYQIAIEFKHRHPDVVAQLGKPLGGAGTGQHDSLSQYLAQRLSEQIKAGKLPHIEGSFLSNQHLEDIAFRSDAGTIHSSLTNTQYTLSMYRIRD